MKEWLIKICTSYKISMGYGANKTDSFNDALL